VVYAGAPDASSVAPEWHAWLHHLTDAPLPETTDEPWRKPYLPNLTGTPEHYQPTPTASTGYRAWTPDQA
jgi:NADH:ubiquinone oxidoreductase subunit